METITYSPLNLFTNFQEAAAGFSETPIICDQPLSAFPELGLETTYKKCFESVLDRAYQLAHLGVKSGDKVIIYKSSAFDTYLLAVSVSYLGAVPVMTSYHLPTATMEVFIDRLEDPFILFDDETKKRVGEISNGTKSKQIPIFYLLEQPTFPVPQSFLAKNEISYMTHTSGTTGIPKLICHSAHFMGWRTKWQKLFLRKFQKRN